MWNDAAAACASPDRVSPIHLPAARARPVGSVDRALPEAPSVSRVWSCAEPATASAFLTRGAESELIRPPSKPDETQARVGVALTTVARGAGVGLTKRGALVLSAGARPSRTLRPRWDYEAWRWGPGGPSKHNIRPGDSDFSLFPCE